jgi:hypothetical protein
LPLERLLEHDPGRLKLREETLDFVGGANGNLGREQELALLDVALEYRPLDAAQNKQRPIAPDMRIEGRLAVSKNSQEAEPLEEVACRFNVGDE